MSRTRWTTGSKLDRASLCPASTVIPEVESEPGNSAIWGSAFHALIEHGELRERECRDGVKVAWPKWVSKGINDKLANMPRPFEEIRAEYWPGGGSHETKGLIEGAHFEVANLIVDGGYPVSEFGIRFKIDYVGVKFGEPWIDDLKTGREPTDPSSLQVAAAALLAAQVTGAQGAWTSITWWPRYPKDNEPSRRSHYHDAASLENVRKVLKVIREDALSGSPTINPARDTYGEPAGQCLYCNSRPNCPAWQGA